MQAPDRHELNAGWTLPVAYGIDRLVLMPRDPHRLFAYWEITSRLQQNMRSQYMDLWDTASTMIRLINIDTGAVKPIEVNQDSSNWYIEGIDPDQQYFAEIGRILDDGRFITMATSNTVKTPRDSLSSVIDPRWRLFAFWQHRCYRRMPGGFSSAEFCCPGAKHFPAEGGSQ